ncbi:MAG: phosphatidylglycerol lysyltransferase domain-containing protein [Candidatus Aceula lacicola]|nr:phosphatidylglycerol lysyltransferase domain-containing protein [Candidatus Aceula lacicola]
MNQDLFIKKEIFDKFLKKTNFDLSSYSFVSIFVWQDFFDFEFQIIDERLCVFAKSDLGTFFYLPPLGKDISRKYVDSCFKILNERNSGKGVSRIENVEEKDLGIFSEKDFIRFEKSKETIYLKSDVAELKGNSFKSKRSDYNYFKKNYKHEIRSCRDDMRKECLSLYDQWAEIKKEKCKDDVYCQMVGESRVALGRCLKSYQKFGFIGKVVIVDEKIAGFAFGFVLKKDTFCILFEIVDIAFKGLATYIFSEFCKSKEIESFSFINVMDDFGLEAVGKTKVSFRPFKQIKTYTISQRD